MSFGSFFLVFYTLVVPVTSASSSQPRDTSPSAHLLIFFLISLFGVIGILGWEIIKECVLLELRSYTDDKPLNPNKL